jgi:hypothetical protein
MRGTQSSISAISREIPEILHINRVKWGDQAHKIGSRVGAETKRLKLPLSTTFSDEHLAPEMNKIAKESRGIYTRGEYL